MKILVVGRGSVGGGLARLWQSAGHCHDVTALGREGGDASDADVLLIAVPGDSISDALSKVTGLAGKTTIDATNSFSGPHGKVFDEHAVPGGRRVMFEVGLAEVHLLHAPLAQQTLHVRDAAIKYARSENQLQSLRSLESPDRDLPRRRCRVPPVGLVASGRLRRQRPTRVESG